MFSIIQGFTGDPAEQRTIKKYINLKHRIKNTSIHGKNDEMFIMPRTKNLSILSQLGYFSP